VRALARELESRVRPGAVVLAYNSIPMIHFLTRSVPALDMPWPILWNRAALARRLARMEAEGPQPVAVVRALTDMGDRRWGGGAPPQPAGAAGPEAERVRLLDEAVRRMGYQPVWSNADFVVLVR
jgi:hypothetical protein